MAVNDTILELRRALGVPERIGDPGLMMAIQVEATLAVAQALAELVDEVAAMRIALSRGGQL